MVCLAVELLLQCVCLCGTGCGQLIVPNRALNGQAVIYSVRRIVLCGGGGCGGPVVAHHLHIGLTFVPTIK